MHSRRGRTNFWIPQPVSASIRCSRSTDPGDKPQLLVGGGWGWKGSYHHQWARSPVGPGQGGTAGGGWVGGRPGLPGHQRRHRPGAGDTHQPAAIQLGHDLHDAPIDGVALTGQLRQLLKQHLNTVNRAHPRGARRSGQRHNPIITGGPTFRPPDPRRLPRTPNYEPSRVKALSDNNITSERHCCDLFPTWRAAGGAAPKTL